MVASLVRSEGIAPAGTALLRDYSVVVVEEFLVGIVSAQRIRLLGHQLTYIDSDKDADAIVLPPRVPLVVEFFGCVVAHYQGVLGKLFVEALLSGAVEKEVERLGDLGQGTQAQQREEGSHGAGCPVG